MCAGRLELVEKTVVGPVMLFGLEMVPDATKEKWQKKDKKNRRSATNIVHQNTIIMLQM